MSSFYRRRFRCLVFKTGGEAEIVWMKSGEAEDFYLDNRRKGRVYVFDNRKRGREFACDNRGTGRRFVFYSNEKFKVGWNCVKNSFHSFLVGGREQTLKSFVRQQTGE